MPSWQGKGGIVRFLPPAGSRHCYTPFRAAGQLQEIEIMSIFHRKAIEAANHPQAVDWLRDEHLPAWTGDATALDRLTPEQRRAAIYNDLLSQLDSAPLGVLFQVPNWRRAGG
jgi:hypothetical protein